IRECRCVDRTRAVDVDSVALTRALVGREEKQLLLAYRTAKIKPELILLQNWSRLPGLVAEKGVCIQRIIAEKLPQSTMKGIAATLRDQLDVCTSVASVGGVVLAGLHLELLDGVGIGTRHASAEGAAVLQVVDGGTIHLNVVVVQGAAVRDDRGAAVSHRATAQGAGIGDIGSNARVKGNNLRIVATYQGQCPDLLPGRYAAERARLGLQLLGVALNHNAF